MQIPILNRRGQFKPMGVPKINWGHPLAQGLVLYLWDTGAGKVVDLCYNRAVTHVPGAVRAATQTTQWGQATNWNSSDGVFVESDSLIRIVAPYTAACAYTVPGTASTNDIAFARTANNGASQPFANWGWTLDNGGSGQNVTGFNFNQAHTLNTSTWTSQAPNAFTSVCQTANAAGTVVTGYAQGSVIFTQGALTLATDNTNDAVLFSGLSNAGVVTPISGSVFYGAFWQRTLSAFEAEALHFDPYQFLIFPEDEIFASLVGVAASAQRFTPPIPFMIAAA